MFHAARLKLTAWYLLIIMLISVSFSIAVYKLLTLEFDRVEHLQQMRQDRMNQVFFFNEMQPPSGSPVVKPFKVILIEPGVIEETKKRLAWRLIAINLGILVLSGVAGYFLAGRTLRPIQTMVDDQNRFISDASHELRTPLTALRTELEVAMRNKQLSLNEAKELLRSNFEEVVTLQTLSNNLLTLLQPKKKRPSETVSLAEALKRALKKVTPMSKKKQIVIENHSTDYTLTGEKESLTELFVILLDNAIKYSSPNTTITITTKQTDHHVIIKFTDQGHGIATEDLPFIFDRFYRAEASRSKEKTSGYGLGLSIAKEIVLTHNGAISVTSKEQKGTTFSVTLPLKLKS